MSSPRYLFVTGGVVSGLGKGICAASLGRLLAGRGLRINMLKCDPYINVDPGTMNPYQHGEVFVTKDGAETDLDLGHYERFLDRDMGAVNSVTAGQVYGTVIERERRGGYLGQTVQVIPHITDEIKRRIRAVAAGCDIAIIEVGGTVGDIESLPFLEALRQVRLEAGHDRVISAHLTLVPYITEHEELKTKPTQHSVGKLREIGIEPNLILCRTQPEAGRLSREVKGKIALFCNVAPEAVVEVPHLNRTVYALPLFFSEQKLDRLLLRWLGLDHRAPHRDGLASWRGIVDQMQKAETVVRIAIAGKYTEVRDSYKSVTEAIHHAAAACGARPEVHYVDVDRLDVGHALDRVDGIIVPGGFGDRGIEGKLRVTHYARTRKAPFLGLCLGLQCAVIDVMRGAGLANANSTEFDPKTTHPVVDVLPEQRAVDAKGGTMRLGAQPCRVRPGTMAFRAYGRTLIQERHRHRYEVNPRYHARLERAGLTLSGIHPQRHLVEIVELRDHPFFMGVQFHPEFQSRPGHPHPLFKSFIAAALARRRRDGEPAATGRPEKRG